MSPRGSFVASERTFGRVLEFWGELLAQAEQFCEGYHRAQASALDGGEAGESSENKSEEASDSD